MSANNESAIKIICTLGPSSLSRDVLTRMAELGVGTFRINMSHTELPDLEGVIQGIRRYADVPLCIDTEGAQIRTGSLANGGIALKDGDAVKLVREHIVGDKTQFTLKPPEVFDSLEPGTLLSVDFDAVLLLVTENHGGWATARVLAGGSVASNKGVSADRPIVLPPFTKKDLAAIEIARKHDIDLFALSFASEESAVLELKGMVGPSSTVISKVETRQGLDDIDGIIRSSDAVLIDRGDLSREIPVEHLPFLQKRIIAKGHQKPLPVYVATNLLESMVTSPLPSRAEISDIASVLADGANGLVLAAETAIGQHPVRCVAMVRRLINHYLNETWPEIDSGAVWYGNGMLTNPVSPHGGRLVDSRSRKAPIVADIQGLPRLEISPATLRDVEQITTGTYSPLAGFMGRDEINSVLDHCSLEDGTPWTMPIVCPGVSQDLKWGVGDNVVLVCSCCNKPTALLEVNSIYVFDHQEVCQRWFGTTDGNHPGVARLTQQGDCFIGGEITPLMTHSSAGQQYSLSAAQVRAIFAHKGWEKVVGFHTRNTPHMGHEYIQLEAMRRVSADGLFIHPVLGQKKPGDFTQEAIFAGYEALIDGHYADDRVLLSGFQANSWYSGPREAIFTAICRKNYGCSHFIVGRDHTGVGDFYQPQDTKELFHRLGDIGIEPVFFDEVIFDPGEKCYREVSSNGPSGKKVNRISGTAIRDYIAKGEAPPEWMMRSEVSEALLQLSSTGNRVFEQ